MKLDEVKEEPLKVTEPEAKTSGLIAFIKDGVTILRDASLTGELGNDGWKVK